MSDPCLERGDRAARAATCSVLVERLGFGQQGQRGRPVTLGPAQAGQRHPPPVGVLGQAALLAQLGAEVEVAGRTGPVVPFQQHGVGPRARREGRPCPAPPGAGPITEPGL